MKTKAIALFTLMAGFNMSYANNSHPHIQGFKIEVKKALKNMPPRPDCLQIALNQVTAASNFFYAEMHDCNMAPEPNITCAQLYIQHVNNAYAIIEANYDSCMGGGYALVP